ATTDSDKVDISLAR
nr:fibrinopeptide B [Rattus norvegicus]